MTSAPAKKFKKETVSYSDPGRILNLVKSLFDESCAALQVKINTYLTEECEAELALQIVVHTERKEAHIEAVGTQVLPRKNKICLTQKFMEMLKTQVIRSDLISTFETDFQDLVYPFVNDPDRKLKKRFVMHPVVGKPFSIIALVMAAKVEENVVAEIIYECFLFTWPVVMKAIAYEFECTLKERCQQLLKVAKLLFVQVSSLDKLLAVTMEHAKRLTKAEYCSVKLIDFDHMELVEAPMSLDPEKRTERRMRMDRGITGQVIKTGQFANVKDVKENKTFCPDTDTIPGIRCKSLLCFPIREQSGIIGVGQLINKCGDPYFDAMDDEMALAFSIYCGVCIMHSIFYKRIEEAHVRNALATEIIMYHIKVSDSEVEKMLECKGFHGHPHVSTLYFNMRALPVRELPCYVYKMYSDLGFINKFQLKREKLCRFILQIKKGYRDVPYHNWHHAFNVAQWAYAAMMNFKLMSLGYFSDLHGLIYLTASLMHDLDHRGTTNSFQLQGQTTLAALYSSEGSVLERHHVAQAMSILNTEGCDILEPLSRRDYDRGLMMLKDFILATDLANYFKNIQEYTVIAEDFNKNNKTHQVALQCLLMNAADLSEQIKDWGSLKKTAAALLTEFFKQGDVEKELGALPAIIMDRDKCVIPELEIQFLSYTVIPLFTMLGKILPKISTSVKIIENHIERWDAAKPIFAEVPITAGLSVLLSPELDNLIEMQMQERIRLAEEAAAEALRIELEERAAAARAAAEAAAKAAEEEDF